MCTSIATTVPITAKAKGPAGWIDVGAVDLGYDHATRLFVEHAVRLDFRPEKGEQVAVEMDLASGKALLDQLAHVIAKAEEHEGGG